MRVAFIAAECEPWAKTGGLADVVDALARALGQGILSVETHGYRLNLVDHPPAFDRDGMYGTSSADHPDNAFRFGVLCRAALERLRRSDRAPDVLHLHDWHAVPALLHRDGDLWRDPVLARATVVLSIHNLAYRGMFARWDMTLTGLDWRLFNYRELEFHGYLSFIKPRNV